jgi:hypothetical protein
MKIGVGYIAFTGGEFLKPSIENIRPFVDHIVVVYAQRSHAGDPAPPYLLPLLEELVGAKLVDEIVHMETEPVDRPACMQDLCRAKREEARRVCYEAGCTHYLIRDCDEFHDRSDLDNAIGYLEENPSDVTITSLFEYWWHPSIRAEQPSGLYVPFIQRADLPLKGFKYPERVDRGRTVSTATTFDVLPVGMIAMHHFTACRFDIFELQRKYQGHGHLNRVHMNADAYILSVKRLIANNPTIKIKDDPFGILKYWREEWPRWAEYEERIILQKELEEEDASKL